MEKGCLLPEDLTIEILLRLCVKSLLRFKSVCKEWNTIISSSSFMRLQSHHENHPYPILGMIFQRDGFKTLSLFSNETLERQHEIPFPSTDSGIHVYGPCNGIFCLTNVFSKKIALWNPATRKLRPLHLPINNTDSINGFGFSIDPWAEDEFKIVLLKTQPPTHFYIYTSNDDSWRHMEEESLYYLSWESDHNIHYNETSYWRMYDRQSNKVGIIGFNMRNETFQTIHLPENVRKVSGKLALSNGCLAILSVVYTYVGDRERVCTTRIVIWIMKTKECWMNLCTVDLPSHSPVSGFWDGQIIALALDNVLVLSNPVSWRMKHIKLLDDEKVYSSQLHLYKETLYSVKGGLGSQDYDIQSAMASEFFCY